MLRPIIGVTCWAQDTIKPNNPIVNYMSSQKNHHPISRHFQVFWVRARIKFRRESRQEFSRDSL